MRIVQWDQSDPDLFEGFFRTKVAAHAADTPNEPPPSATSLRFALTEGEERERKEVWAAVDSGAGSGGAAADSAAGSGGAAADSGAGSAGRVAGWYRLLYPDRENLHVGFLTVLVHPDRRRRGIGTELLRHAAGRAAADGRTLLAGDTAQGGAGDAFAQRVGAKPGVLEAQRVLDVGALPAGRVAALRAAAAAAAAGYSLVSWTGPVPEEHLDGFAYVEEAMNDAPFDYEDERWDADRVREVNARIERRGNRRYVVIAVHDATGQTAAFTEMDVNPEIPEWGFQHNTGVARPHRGHRLGMLLKTAMLEWLAETEPQLKRITTGNAATNKHMIAINEEIGFEVLPPGWQNYDIPVAKVLG